MPHQAFNHIVSSNLNHPLCFCHITQFYRVNLCPAHLKIHFKHIITKHVYSNQAAVARGEPQDQTVNFFSNFVPFSTY